jgi:acyl carrier protein
MKIKDQLRNYLAKNLLFSDKGFNYYDDTSFQEEGIIDPCGVIELIAYIKETFDVDIEDQEVTPENFDSVNKLAVFLHRKMNGSI